MATQNPIEQEGTYPLPEAQLDRFLMHVRVDYPTAAEERAVLQLVRGETRRRGAGRAAADRARPQSVFAARAEIARHRAAAAIEDLYRRARRGDAPAGRFGDKLARWIALGASPRGTIALDRCARAHAWLAGRDYVTPEDVQAVAPECCAIA